MYGIILFPGSGGGRGYGGRDSGLDRGMDRGMDRGRRSPMRGGMGLDSGEITSVFVRNVSSSATC